MFGYQERAVAGCHVVWQGISSHIECEADPCSGGCSTFGDPVTNLYALAFVASNDGHWAIYHGSDVNQASSNALRHCRGNCTVRLTADPSGFACIAVSANARTVYASRRQSLEAARNAAHDNCQRAHAGGCEQKFAACNDTL